MSGHRRSVRQWLRDDLRKAIGFREAVRLIRRHPRVLWRFVLYLVATYGLLVAALAVTGYLANFGAWAAYPAVLAAGRFGVDLYMLRESASPNGVPHQR